MKCVAVLLFVCLLSSPVFAQDADRFQTFLQNVGQEAIAAGVSPATVARALPSIEHDETVIELDRKQPEKKITFTQYVKNVITPQRIAKGQRLGQEYEAALKQLEQIYGVPPAMVLSLWGIESSFGANQGDFSVLSSLATLAYEGRRADFFRNELIEALKILDEEGMTPEQLTGSWAGAMGHAQFMPSTFRKFAMDGDADGHRDIWTDEVDAIASIARYLAAEGWQAGQSWGEEVRLTKPVAESETGPNVALDLATWQRYGVRMSSNTLQKKDISASLIRPDGAGGRSFLVYDNFRALMRWNRSTYFATSVGLLADHISNGL